ncbi:MAG: hypothetical protein GX773_02125 [Chloroflexi bacterium]|nr:hypothetical protein [Chloroflexota bacterium]
MKNNLKLLIRMLLIGLILSSCVVEATESVPTGITGIAETELSGQYETLQAIITEQAATLESLSTLESPTQAKDDTGELTVIEKDGFILNLPNQVAKDIVVSNVLPDDPEEGWPELALPARRVIGFGEYSIPNHFHKPLIYVISIQKMIDDGQYGGTMATNLQALLADPNFDLQQEGNLPFLPPFNAAQVFHVLEKRLDSDHNSGIRFLTLYSQGIVGVTNYEIFYTYQGISADGRYYIAAVLPVKSSLLSDTQLSNEDLEKIVDEYQNYIGDMTDLIRTENGGIVTPSLEALDAMMMSLVSQN